MEGPNKTVNGMASGTHELFVCLTFQKIEEWTRS